MADRVLFVGWSGSVAGREERSLEVFNDAVGICSAMQDAGRIEHFNIVLLEPNSDLGGYFEIHGTAEQIADVREDEAFRHNTVDAALSVEGLRHIEGYTGEAIATQMAQYRDAVGQVTHAV